MIGVKRRRSAGGVLPVGSGSPFAAPSIAAFTEILFLGLHSSHSYSAPLTATAMSMESFSPDVPAALADEPAQAVEDQAGLGRWAETALTIAFATAAVLLVSFVAVATGLV